MVKSFLCSRGGTVGFLRRCLWLFTALLLVFAAAGCGNSANNTGTNPTTKPTTNPAPSAAENSSGSKLTVATTTSVRDSGLMAYLQPEFEKDTGIKLNIVAQGSGQAIRTGEDGNADVLLVHDKAAEEKFVSSGNGLKRIEVMYNYFVIVGPRNDPAGIKASGTLDAAKAFKMISDKKAPFISRGDKSGTNTKELNIWTSANITPSGDWYVSAGKGMGDVLTMASEKQAYTLTDKATYLSMKDKLDLQIVLENAQDLKNQYTIIAVNPANHKGINSEGAQKFIDWMTSEKGLKMIGEYGRDKYGENLFTVNFSGK
ncbi:MAG: extracellular solute-binding protein [Clostridiales bacterium]|jgi:tungstate transport system substrate-binding protein|nr:extracellular solute-binding protein [Eubacteriales bacterium]MDH7566476.1 extracellular solute-binding protein [Clostridiales bacterium]